MKDFWSEKKDLNLEREILSLENLELEEFKSFTLALFIYLFIMLVTFGRSLFACFICPCGKSIVKMS